MLCNRSPKWCSRIFAKLTNYVRKGEQIKLQIKLIVLVISRRKMKFQWSKITYSRIEVRKLSCLFLISLVERISRKPQEFDSFPVAVSYCNVIAWYHNGKGLQHIAASVSELVFLLSCLAAWCCPKQTWFFPKPTSWFLSLASSNQWTNANPTF